MMVELMRLYLLEDLTTLIETFSIFNDKMKSIELCVSRFDEDTKESFLDLYTKIDIIEDVQGMSDSDENLDDPEDKMKIQIVNQ